VRTIASSPLLLTTMNAQYAALRRATVLRSSLPTARQQWTRHASSSSEKRGGGGLLKIGAVFGLAAAGVYAYPLIKEYAADEKAVKAKETAKAAKEPVKAALEYDRPRRAAVSKEDNRDLLSSQHLQVKNSWEHPGVYAWGANAGKVVDPESNDKYVKTPRRLAYFDDQLLRDLKLTAEFGAAITEKGDLVQWGLGFDKANPKPSVTLPGKDLVRLEVSADRIIALAKNGSVLSIPASRDDQQGGVKKDTTGSSMSLWSNSGSEKISFRELTPKNLGWGEKVTDVRSGRGHCLMLTSGGRVFSAASATSEFPSRGQMGIPGLTWETRPEGAYDQAHEITALSGFGAAVIAAGDNHSLVLDKSGRLFSFGDNMFGQLAFEGDDNQSLIDTPTLVSIAKLYSGTGLVPKVTTIAAGGQNTFFTVDAEAPKSGDNTVKSLAPARRMPRAVTDTWSAGRGVLGALGTGRWTHVSVGPAKVKGLSSLFEFDEKTNQMRPIKLKALNVGATHVSATMDNVTETSITSKATENETNWGADVMFWGGNEYFQLGTGKRNNLNAPAYIGPLDGGAGDAEKGRQGEMHRLCLTPKSTARIGEDGKGRKVTLEQKVECGRYATAVYSAV